MSIMNMEAAELQRLIRHIQDELDALYADLDASTNELDSYEDSDSIIEDLRQYEAGAREAYRTYGNAVQDSINDLLKLVGDIIQGVNDFVGEIGSAITGRG